jgi:CrcB protein
MIEWAGVEQDLLSLLLVTIGGALGAVARFWLSGAIGRRVGETFPWGTLAVNVTGSAAIGMLAGILTSSGTELATSQLWLALATGVLGSYTTVSSFSLQSMTLMRAGEWRHASWNILASLMLCLAAAAAGITTGSALVQS